MSAICVRVTQYFLWHWEMVDKSGWMWYLGWCDAPTCIPQVSHRQGKYVYSTNQPNLNSFAPTPFWGSALLKTVGSRAGATSPRAQWELFRTASATGARMLGCSIAPVLRLGNCRLSPFSGWAGWQAAFNYFYQNCAGWLLVRRTALLFSFL